MKAEERKRAVELRTQGKSIKEIAKRLNVSRGSVSVWVRDIKLTEEQRQTLNDRGFNKDAIEKRRLTRLKNESVKRQRIIESAGEMVEPLSKQKLLLIGSALYWAEGAKTNRGAVQFSNSDPKMIKLMMKFFRKICHVEEKKFRGYIHIHPHLNSTRAERYWSSISGIPLEQFYKTYRKPNKASKNKRDSLPFGVFDIYICDTKLFLRIKGWTKKMYELSNVS